MRLCCENAYVCVCVCVQVLVVESRHTGQRFVVKVLYKSLQLSSRGRGVATNRALVSPPLLV